MLVSSILTTRSEDHEDQPHLIVNNISAHASGSGVRVYSTSFSYPLRLTRVTDSSCHRLLVTPKDPCFVDMPDPEDIKRKEHSF